MPLSPTTPYAEQNMHRTTRLVGAVLGLTLLLGGCSSEWPSQAEIERFCGDWTQNQPEEAAAYLSNEQCIQNAIQTRDWGCSWDVWKANPHLSGRLAHYPGCDDGADL